MKLFKRISFKEYIKVYLCYSGHQKVILLKLINMII